MQFDLSLTDYEIGPKSPKTKQCLTRTSPAGQRCLQPIIPSLTVLRDGAAGPATAGTYGSGYYGDEAAYGDTPGPARFPDSVDETLCVEMSCSGAGEVLVDGVPCDPGTLAPLTPGYLVGG
jgi:hypothetical protein